jgi:hypothetical protein
MLRINRQTVLASLILGILFVLMTVVTHDVFTAPYPGHNDFVSRYIPLRAFWLEGIDPYSDVATARIHQVIYGRAALPTEDPGLFAYPFYILFVLLPVMPLDYAWASAVFMVALEFMLLGALFALLDLFQWRPKPILLGVLLLFTLLSYFPMRGLLLGQPGVVVYGLQVGVLWALAKKRDGLAGVLLALSTIKPQMGYLFVPLIGLWGLFTARWHFVGLSAGTFGALILASFVFLPSWFSEWLAQVALYPTYTALGSPLWILAHYAWLDKDPITGLWGVQGGFGAVLDLLFSAMAYGYLAWAWWGVLIQGKRERVLWAIALTLIMTHLVAPRTATPHYVIFFIPLIFGLREWTLRRKRQASWGAPLLLLLIALAQWAHFLLTVDGEFEHPSVYLPTALAALAFMVITRRWWWQDAQARLGGAG